MAQASTTFNIWESDDEDMLVDPSRQEDSTQDHAGVGSSEVERLNSSEKFDIWELDDEDMHVDSISFDTGMEDADFAFDEGKVQASAKPIGKPKGLLELPREIRDHIYGYLAEVESDDSHGR
jgi:hypothetical protein